MANHRDMTDKPNIVVDVERFVTVMCDTGMKYLRRLSKMP